MTQLVLPGDFEFYRVTAPRLSYPSEPTVRGADGYRYSIVKGSPRWKWTVTTHSQNKHDDNKSPFDSNLSGMDVAGRFNLWLTEMQEEGSWSNAPFGFATPEQKDTTTDVLGIVIANSTSKNGSIVTVTRTTGYVPVLGEFVRHTVTVGGKSYSRLTQIRTVVDVPRNQMRLTFIPDLTTLFPFKNITSWAIRTCAIVPVFFDDISSLPVAEVSRYNISRMQMDFTEWTFALS